MMNENGESRGETADSGLASGTNPVREWFAQAVDRIQLTFHLGRAEAASMADSLQNKGLKLVDQPLAQWDNQREAWDDLSPDALEGDVDVSTDAVEPEGTVIDLRLLISNRVAWSTWERKAEPTFRDLRTEMIDQNEPDPAA